MSRSKMIHVKAVDSAVDLNHAEGAEVAAVADKVTGAILVKTVGSSGGGAGGTEYTEDAAAVANPVGPMTMARRKDTLSSSEVSADGDNIALNATNKGQLHVKHADAIDVGTQPARDAAADDITIYGQFDDVGTSTPSENGLAAVRITQQRAIHVNLRDASGSEVAAGIGTQYTEDAAAASDPVGQVPMLVRKDTPAGITSADGDNVAQRGTDYGAAYVTVLDTAGAAVLGAKTDAKSTATDTTAVSAISVLKQISASVQAPPSQAVTNAGTFAVQAACTIADGSDVTIGAKTDAKSAATDGTSVSAMSVLKQISASVQAPPSQAVTNAGTFAVQNATAASTIPTATTMQNAATGNGNGTSLPVTGYTTAILNVVSSVAMSGGTTVNFEASVDDTTWVSILAHQVGVAGTLGTTTTADGDFRINCAGYKSIRARISGYSAGTVTIKGYTIAISGHPTTVGLATGSSTVGSIASVTTSVVPGTAATNLGKAEDAAHTTGDVGVFDLSVSNENLTAFAAASGDYTPKAVNRYGEGYVTAPPPSRASSNGTPITATTTGIVSAPSAGNHLRITRLSYSNGGSTATWVALRDGAAGTQYYRFYLPQGGAISLNLKLTGPLDLTTATRLDIVLSAAGSVEYTIDYLTVAD